MITKKVWLSCALLGVPVAAIALNGCGGGSGVSPTKTNPAATARPVPTSTTTPGATATPVPGATATPVPNATATPVPERDSNANSRANCDGHASPNTDADNGTRRPEYGRDFGRDKRQQRQSRVVCSDSSNPNCWGSIY